MLLYILSSSLISLSSSNNIECGYIIWSENNDEYYGEPLGVCSVEYNNNYKFICDSSSNGLIINKLYYDTTDCSGEPSNTVDNFCENINAKSCSKECNTNSCNNFITKTYYKSSDCSVNNDNDITQRNIYLKNECLGSSSSTYKHSCNGTKIQFNKYSNSDCSGNTQPPEYKHNTSCISLNDGTSYKWDGCGDNDDCLRFKLFVTIIIVFIHIISFN